MLTTTRPDFYPFAHGEKAVLPFTESEYNHRLELLRKSMQSQDVDFVVLTSMQNIAYYSGFLYCAFGRPYALVVSPDSCVTVSANIDAGQPWRRSFGESIIYTDWKRDNYWRALKHGGAGRPCRFRSRSSDR